MKSNLIIRASAGTGKTFSLATRFIRLMLFDGVSPEKIVALTFSRAAAQEIYTKLLERLWSAAMTDEGAEKERRILLSGLSAGDRAAAEAKVRDWSRAGFARVLKLVVDTQHFNAIATLDSFILRIVRSFPLEMGFQKAVDVLDAYGEENAVSKAREKLLSDRGAGDAFIAAFKLAQKGEFVRTCSTALGSVLAGWRDFVVVHPEAKSWTAEGMRAALGIDADAPVPDLSAVPVSGKPSGALDKVVARIRAFREEGKFFDDTVPGQLLRDVAKHPSADVLVYLAGKDKKEVQVACGAAGAAALREAVRWMAEQTVSAQLDVVAAKLRLCALVEGEYDAATRRQGLLTFSDFTDCQATNEDSDRGLALQNLQFRFDSRFDHWALDEFQDTSELQWKCLKRLVREAAGGGMRSVMAVGDLKQSIYTWRGGNDAPFKEMMCGWGEFRDERGEIVKSDVSYRYEKNTADFVNAVFGPGNVRGSGLAGADCESACERWLAEDCWMEHHPDRDRDGREKAGDYVELGAGEPETEPGDAAPAPDEEEEGGGAAMKRLAPKLCEKVRDFWFAHEAAGSTDTVGVLVRNNRDGAYLAERLREMDGCDLPVVWEGAAGVLDAPVVRAVLELLRLAAHPEDTFAWSAVNTLFPVRELVFPEGGTAAYVSLRVARMLSQLGLARTLREVVSALAKSENGLDDRSRERLEALVREGVNFEQRRDGAADIGKFGDYLAATAGREIASSPRVIRILSIHRSKGLTLDHVFVPVLETGKSDSVVKPRKGTVLAGPGWVAGALSEDVAKAHPLTRAAWVAAANARFLEQLRMYYVALTRARRSTHVFLLDDAHEGCVQFRDLLLAPFAAFARKASAYGTVRFEAGTMPAFGTRSGAPVRRIPWTHDGREQAVSRRSPSAEGGSAGHGAGVPGATLFGDGYGSAAARGSAEHAGFAALAWLDPTQLRDDLQRRIWDSPWREAFERRDGVQALWRERAYEYLEGDVWESGQFDRVVFSGSGATRTATVYDFKTNTPHDGESVPAFETRMRETYAGQMRAYRHALSRLTGIAEEAIALRLLLSATMSRVDLS